MTEMISIHIIWVERKGATTEASVISSALSSIHSTTKPINPTVTMSAAATQVRGCQKKGDPRTQWNNDSNRRINQIREF